MDGICTILTGKYLGSTDDAHCFKDTRYKLFIDRNRNTPGYRPVTVHIQLKYESICIVNHCDNLFLCMVLRTSVALCGRNLPNCCR